MAESRISRSWRFAVGAGPPRRLPAPLYEDYISVCCGFARLFIGTPLPCHRLSIWHFHLTFPFDISIRDFHLGFPFGISIWHFHLTFPFEISIWHFHLAFPFDNNKLIRTQRTISIKPADPMRVCRRKRFACEFDKYEFLTARLFYSMF